MSYLIFNTQAEAITADEQVALNFNLSGGTTRYQQEIALADGRFALPMPPQVVLRHPPAPNEYGGFDEIVETRDPLFGVTGYTTAEDITVKAPPDGNMV